MRIPKTRASFTEPARADLDWLAQQVQQAGALAGRYAGISGWAENDLEALDQAFEAWSRDAAETRANPTEVAQACGVAVGQVIARRIGLKWMVREHRELRVLALWGRSASGAVVSVSPVEVVAERMEEGLTGFLAELAAGLCDDLQSDLGK